MGSELSWILLCLILGCVGVTTRSFENYGYNYYNFDESLYQRSRTPQDEVQRDIDISMPNVHPKKHDSYFCTSVKMNTKEYITGYEPHAEMHTAHHMLLFGCESLPTEDKSWNCGDMGVGVCSRGSGEKIMYAWGRNAPVLKLPKDVAFEVGDTDTRYLVLQVHYGHVDKFIKNPKLTDHSGVVLKATNKRPRSFKKGEILLLASDGSIPPHKKVFNLDLSCIYSNKAIIHPFAFRVHAHSLGRVVTGYRIRNNKWKLIGKGDPQRPQAFYDVIDKTDIRPGDTLAARCTYDSTTRDRTTYIGATMKDEMCNFYTMFYYDPETTNSSPEDSCGYNYKRLHYPSDSIVPLPDNGQKMVMKRDEDPCPNCKRSTDTLNVDEKWPAGGPSAGQLPNDVGQITGVSMATNGDVVIFHRATRSWQMDTFDDNELKKKYRTPIKEYTVTWLDATTGLIKKQWGDGMFYLPHGLTVDKEDNLWLTDVGSHQVFKFPKGNKKASIVIGKRFIPGSDNEHLCKPTGVALDSDGNFFVSDGYCNQRILKYSPKKILLRVIAKQELVQGGASPDNFFIPHSVSIDKVNDTLYVADRENGRVLVFNTKTGSLLRIIDGFGSRVFAAHYSPLNGGLLHVVNGDDGMSKISGFTYSLQVNKITQTWSPLVGFEMPHDVASDNVGHVYVAEIKHQQKDPGRIWKFV